MIPPGSRLGERGVQFYINNPISREQLITCSQRNCQYREEGGAVDYGPVLTGGIINHPG